MRKKSISSLKSTKRRSILCISFNERRVLKLNKFTDVGGTTGLLNCGVSQNFKRFAKPVL